MLRRLLLLLLVLPALALASCGDDEDDEGGSDAAATTTETAPDPAEPAGGGDSVLPEGCTVVETPEPKPEPSLSAPDDDLDASQTHVVTFETNCGAFEVTLDVESSPKTSSSVAALVERGFYDNLIFHRIVPGFVIQAGDPLGIGQGGPGYSVTETPRSSATYTKGVVAMAKTEIEDPGTSGSQFFVVTGEDSGLPPDYAVLGEVTEGIDVVERIGSVPVGPGDVPVEPVVIESASLESR